MKRLAIAASILALTLAITGCESEEARRERESHERAMQAFDELSRTPTRAQEEQARRLKALFRGEEP